MIVTFGVQEAEVALALVVALEAVEARNIYQDNCTKTTRVRSRFAPMTPWTAKDARKFSIRIYSVLANVSTAKPYKYTWELKIWLQIPSPKPYDRSRKQIS